MDLFTFVLMITSFLTLGFVCGYHCNQINVDYYRDLVYAYECQETRKMFK